MQFEDFILKNEENIRLGFFLGTLAFIGAWEFLFPRRKLTEKKWIRWLNNLGLVFFNTFILRTLIPVVAVSVAVQADENGWGILNWIQIPGWLSVIAGIVVLDLIIYLQHVMVHAVPLLWRLHRVHHADLDYDVTTGLRFHTLEIILSMGIKFAAIILFGPPVLAVILFEVILNAMAMFNHGNIVLPGSLDRILRLGFVTPDMHRVHHSIHDDETNSNFGFNISLWDRIFGTYRNEPRDGHEGMTIGIREVRDSKSASWITGILIMPFIGKVNSYAINRRSWSSSDEK